MNRKRIAEIPNRKVNVKTLVLVTVAVALIVCAGTFYVRSDVSPAIYLDDHPAQAYYTVKTDGTNYWAVRYDGDIIYEGTTAHTVINNAINGLTSGRVFKEKVALRGSFTLSSSIVPKSYLVLDCSEAKITCSSSINMLYITSTTLHVDILGGHWVGYTSSSGRFCNFGSSSYILIQGCTVSNVYIAVELTPSAYHITIDHCTFKSPLGSASGGSALYTNSGHNIYFTNNIVTAGGSGAVFGGGGYYCNKVIGNDFSGWVGSLNHAVYLDYGGWGCEVKDNAFHDRGSEGGVTILCKAQENDISHNVFYNHDLWGIQIQGQYSSASRNKVAYNEFYGFTNAYGGCISLGAVAGTPQTQNLTWNEVMHNGFYDCTLGISLGGNASANAYTDHTLIWDNQFIITTGTGTKRGILIEDSAEVRYTKIHRNNFNNLTTNIDGSGTDTDTRYNMGHKTEASSSALNTTATTFVIAHGLVTTPIIVLASFNATEVTSWKWTADASDITITMTGTLAGNVTAYWEARTWHYP